MADKSTPTLGKLIMGNQLRDAVHIAIVPVVATQYLEPAQNIGFKYNDIIHVGEVDNPIGIVDPFLTEAIRPGERFWMFLYPNTITSLRHDWTHPAFCDLNTSEAESYLRNFAERANIGYQFMLDTMAMYLRDGKAWIQYGSEAARDAYENIDKDELWKNFNIVTGINTEARHNKDFDISPFCCSC